MGKLLDLLISASGEKSLFNRLGHWRQEISQEVDKTTARVDQIESTAAGEALAGPGLVPDGTRLAVGQNPDNSIVVNEDNVQLNPALQATIAGSGISALGGLGYLTQTDWGVDSIAGNDANPGTNALPLKTLEELSRRWYGRTFAPSLTNVAVQLTGVFTLNQLGLVSNVPGATEVEVLGMMTTTVAAQAITVYTAEAPPTRASLTAGVFDFSPHIRSRLRMVTGTQAGAVATIMSVPALGTANISQFERIVAGAISTVNPTAGDQFVIETYATQIREYDIQLAGAPTFRLRDLEIGSLVSTYVPQSYMSVAGTSVNRAQIFGCRYSGAAGASQIVRGSQTYGGCQITVPFWTVSVGTHTCMGLAQFSFVQTSTGCNMISNRWCGDGNGTAHVGFLLGNGSYCEDIAPRGVFGCINGTITELVRIEDFAQWVESSATAVFYGATGNTTTNAIRARNGTGMVYVTKPTATGATPGLDVVLANNAAIAWAAVPAVAAAPDNAFVNVR